MKRLLFTLLLLGASLQARPPETIPNDTPEGLLLCGYQGWFNTPGDGSGRGWRHYRGTDGRFDADSAGIDCWPDMSEASPQERYETPLRKPDGSPAFVFSSRNSATVDRHFRWMREYGISGVFFQRFLQEIRTPGGRENSDAVMANVRSAARKHGRVWALMYDASGCEEFAVFERDFRRFAAGGAAGEPAYLRYRGRPLVAVWGLFANRPGSIPFFEKAVALAHELGYSVMAGADSHWRTAKGEAAGRVRAVLEQAELVSPWMVGRFSGTEAERYYRETVRPDAEWCRSRGIGFLPVVFPGFSWGNLKGKGFDLIPRENGAFFRRQLELAEKCGAGMIYVAMFDEMDEGTAIFKLDSVPPSGGRNRFLAPPPPSDLYLRLAGEAAERLRRRAAAP